MLRSDGRGKPEARAQAVSRRRGSPQPRASDDREAVPTITERVRRRAQNPKAALRAMRSAHGHLERAEARGHSVESGRGSSKGQMPQSSSVTRSPEFKGARAQSTGSMGERLTRGGAQ